MKEVGYNRNNIKIPHKVSKKNSNGYKSWLNWKHQ